MYITQEITNRIKLEAKSQKISMKELLSNCDLNINAISEFSKGKLLSCLSLAKIADYLDCSVDYLLGRTNNPNIQSTVINSNSNNSITNTGIIKGNNSANIILKDKQTNNESSEFILSKQALELAEIFDSLGIREQSEILLNILETEKRNKKNKTI